MIHPEDQVVYSKHYTRFVARHREAFDALYLDGNPGAAKNEMARLDREFRTLPPRHDCTCWPNHCAECARIARERVDAPTAVEIGHTRPAQPPTPNVTMLDINAGYAA